MKWGDKMSDIWSVVSTVVTYIIALIAGGVIGGALAKQYYKKFKDALTQIRNCIDAVDNAFADDSITKEEVKAIYEKCVEPIKKL